MYGNKVLDVVQLPGAKRHHDNDIPVGVVRYKHLVNAQLVRRLLLLLNWPPKPQ